MNVYQELTIIPQGEDISPCFIWSKLYMQLHLAFVECKDSNDTIPYGVSFPQYRVDHKGDRAFMQLGSKLRIFAHSESELQQLNIAQWLARLSDYVHISSIQPVPTDKPIHHLRVKRNRAKPFHAKRNAAYAQRRGISEAQAKRHFTESNTLKPLPFITLKSLTNAQVFSLKIDQQRADTPCLGRFSTYGFSTTSTVPHW